MENLKCLSNVILLTRGTKGDLYPFINIGCGFKSRGYNVILLSNYCYEAYALKEGLEFAPLDDEKSYQIFNNMPEYYKDLPSLLNLYKEHTVATVERELQIIEDIVAKGNTTIIANSNHYLASMFAKEKFNISLHLCILAPSYSHGFSLFEAFLSRLSDDLNELRIKIGLPLIDNWGLWLKNFSTCFAFWPSWFSDGSIKNIDGIKHLGFLAIDKIEDLPLQDEVKNFIEGNQKIILITHGTSKPFDDDFFRLAIDVCATLGHRLIISTPFRELLPRDLPDHTIWVDFCPFHKLLPAIDLIIHHGGIGTTREAIANITPQIIIGQGFDRQHNAKIVRELGVGDWIAPRALNFNKLVQSVEHLLSKTEVKLKCKKLKLSLYNPNAIHDFYECIINYNKPDKSTIEIQNFSYQKSNRSQLTPFSKYSNADANSASVALSFPLRTEMSNNKQKLLSHILKNKSFEVTNKK